MESLLFASAGSQPEQAAGYRLGLISLLAAFIGMLAGIVAYLLYDLIGLFTNLAYYHEWSLHFRSPGHAVIGPWIVVTPVIGGIIIGFMAKYGSEKIKGHGIPEAMEAVLTSRSRIAACLGRRGGHGGYIQHANCGRHSRD